MNHKHAYKIESIGDDRTVHKMSCACGDVKWSGCKVMRRFEVRRSSMNLTTGNTTQLDTKTLVQLCASPLFTEEDKHLGVCASCRGGWEIADNMFASEEERIAACGTGPTKIGSRP